MSITRLFNLIHSSPSISHKSILGDAQNYPELFLKVEHNAVELSTKKTIVDVALDLIRNPIAIAPLLRRRQGVISDSVMLIT